MNIFAIGDLHLSFDERIQKPMDIFGPSWVNHHEKVRKNWEEKVGEEDLVIIPATSPGDSERMRRWQICAGSTGCPDEK